ncbi:MAG TPA: MBL fold metallo-hydrolase [Acidimicrobiales bacterium]|nr:MBL fold metallo-hydrolase [Acidimicrobiales bacterium]
MPEHARPIAAGTGLELIVLGCDGSYAGPGGASSGYLVRSASTSLWLDTGPGTLGRVQHHVALEDLTAVVVTHEHPDHCGELPVLRNALRYVLGVECLAVLTTEGTRELVDRVCDGAEPTFAWDVVAAGGERRVGDLRLRFARTDHPVETMAVRIDHEAGSLAYTSDTGGGFDGAALDPDGTGVDVLVVEATMPPELEDRAAHLSARQAAGVAAACGAREVVVTHVAPRDDPRRRCREVEAALAELGLEVPVRAAAAHQTSG